MKRSTIYVIDDEELIREWVIARLEDTYTVSGFSTAHEGIAAVQTEQPDLVLLDIGLPDMSGLDALHSIKQSFPDILIIMITANNDIDQAISAMKLDAYDYVLKPLNGDRLDLSIRNALESIRLRKEVQLLQEKYLSESMPCFIGESNSIQDIMEFITRVAQSPDTPILILGETGTGKELLASAVHFRSPNFKGPLITVNCAAIPLDLIESELFGYEKGAFSGANAAGKKGLIEEAAGGTLFLDEIGDLSLAAQAKLLRFLEEGEFYRVGSTKKINVATRVVSATNKDLGAMVEENRFRKDLIFRLGVIKLQIPSLNERRDDILPLAKHFLVTYNQKFKKTFGGISDEAVTALKTHNWTGNVRELRNIFERAVLIGQEPEITLQDLDLDGTSMIKPNAAAAPRTPYPPLTTDGIDLVSAEKQLQKFYIDESLKLTGGNETKAAKLLNINHHTFRYRKKNLADL
ncbi:MAG: sigma-54-dependent Fis family transcriptional regulator [Deltaproteobacteria bacterium]|nr:sigma-54-dependent Fis family transcriptional regulator [Deltaproteobacteria bacterium]